MHSRNVNDISSMPPVIAKFARTCAAVLALGLGFAWFGVYGTGDLPFVQRFLYWTALMAVGVGASQIFVPLVFDRWLTKQHAALRILAAAALISVPVTIGLLLIEHWAWGARTTAPFFWLLQGAYVLAVSIILTAGAYGIDLLQQRNQPASGQGTTKALPPFADRLPLRMRAADIYAVSAEDHYLRVHTSAGEELILFRLSDAMRELSGIDGLQTHRSWWVARQGLADVSRGDGKLTLKLKSGVEAPVSRTYAPTVRAAGWI